MAKDQYLWFSYVLYNGGNKANWGNIQSKTFFSFKYLMSFQIIVILNYCHSELLSFRIIVIPNYCHSELLSFRIIFIPNYCHSKLLSFRIIVILNIPITQPIVSQFYHLCQLQLLPLHCRRLRKLAAIFASTV